jgi:adenylate cyclase, class 2
MPIEVEKKYRLTKKQQEELRKRLPAIGAKRIGEEFEENTLYEAATINTERCVLRLRRIGKKGKLTFKERLASASDIKLQQEEETAVDNPDAMAAILDAIGFVPAVVYEKRRETWRLRKTEIVIDELPFGLFMEIEGAEDDIRAIEKALAMKLRAETSTYPQLSRQHGRLCGDVREARFKQQRSTK